MDANKLSKLQEIAYEINPCCALCIYSTFPNNDWGTCAKHVYDHQKHNGTHNLSIHRLGHCSDFALDERKTEDMRHYREFFK